MSLNILKIALVGLLMILFVRIGSDRADKWWKKILLVATSVACFVASIYLSIIWIIPMYTQLLDK